MMECCKRCECVDLKGETITASEINYFKEQKQDDGTDHSFQFFNVLEEAAAFSLLGVCGPGFAWMID